jgi:hypothetical protein
MVFLNSPYREASKNVLKKKVGKNGGLVGYSKVNQIYVKVRHFFFECPSDPMADGKAPGLIYTKHVIS